MNDFIANASHELRTPLTIIRGFAETLQDFPALSDEMRREIIDKIVQTCGRMEKLVKSLLLLSDVEHALEEHFQPCNLLTLAATCQQQLLTACPTVSISIESHCPHPVILANSDLLELAIMNVLENAVRYSVGSAEIVMCIRPLSRGVSLDISDRGMGIPAEEIAQIFERFYTVNKSHSRKLGGAGLGLSIVKAVLDKHKGTCCVISEVGKGSTFSLQFTSPEGLVA